MGQKEISHDSTPPKKKSTIQRTNNKVQMGPNNKVQMFRVSSRKPCHQTSKTKKANKHGSKIFVSFLKCVYVKVSRRRRRRRGGGGDCKVTSTH
jgi:hypothetical protein